MKLEPLNLNNKPVRPTDLSKIETTDLEKMFAECLRMSAENVLFAGRCVLELEKRGRNVSGLCGRNFIKYLRLIGSGTFEPEIAVRYAGSWELLDTLAALPMDQQRRIIEDSKISVAIADKDETYDLVELPRRFFGQVFGGSHIRTPEEQRKWLALAIESKRTEKPSRILKSRPDYRTGGIKVGNATVAKADVILSLSDSASPLDFVEEKGTEYEVISAKVTQDEKARLRALVKQSGETESDLIRRALRTLGMI